MNIATDRGDVGIRVDRVLLRHLRALPGISRTRIQRLVESGAVRINGLAVPRASRRLAAGDELVVDLPTPPERTRPAAEALPLDILFEDEHLLAVNKPAGQVVHPSFRNTSGTLLNAILHHAERAGWIDPRPHLVQRLDKDTSGIVLVAKTRAVHAAIQRAMQTNAVDKDYLAVVHGKPVPLRGTIDLALDRDPWDRRRVMVHDRGGQPSVTRYERLATGRSANVSLVRCRLITGRTHQIRVHLLAKGWPIVGDKVYGSRSPGDERALPESIRRFPRQALHAWKLRLAHPVGQQPLDFEAPIPPDLETLLQASGMMLR